MGKDSEWISINEVKEQTGITRGLAAYIIKKYAIKAVKIGNALHYKKVILLDAIALHEKTKNGCVEVLNTPLVNDELMNLVLKYGFGSKFDYKKNT